jgi:glycosyltransferase involved in cell wall biosynthesis
MAFRQDAVVAVSDYVLKDYLAHVGFRGKTHVLYNFIPDSFFTHKSVPAVPAKGAAIRCVAVGNLKPLKNYRYILDAFSQVTHLPVTLDIYGEGTEGPHLQEIITRDGLPVRLLGVNNKMQEVLPQYDVFIQASLYEGYGIALLEAMTVGLIPLLSDIPVHREVTEGKVFYFNLDDTRTLAQLLFHVHAGAFPLQSVSEGMMHRARQIGTARNYKQKLENIYENLGAAI